MHKSRHIIIEIAATKIRARAPETETTIAKTSYRNNTNIKATITTT